MLSPQPKLNPYDIRVDIWRPVLAAGEVRVTHLPTGLAARSSIGTSMRDAHRAALTELEQLVATHEAVTA